MMTISRFFAGHSHFPFTKLQSLKTRPTQRRNWSPKSLKKLRIEATPTTSDAALNRSLVLLPGKGVSVRQTRNGKSLSAKAIEAHVTL